MSETSTTSQDRSERGRFMLLPEDPAAAVPAGDPRRPRIRRYRLTRLGGEAGAVRGDSERRAGDGFAYLRRPHD